MNFPAVTYEVRGQMWVNFLNECRAGTILEDFNGDAWQKDSEGYWLRAGVEYQSDPGDIPWPMVVLHGGIG
jgi:hypothetical protein